MAHSNRWVAFCFSKAFRRHNHGAGPAPFPFPATTAFVKKVHVNTAEGDEVKGDRTSSGSTAAEALEMAFDTTKGTREMVKDTVLAEADENVVDTAEYRSMEDNMNPPKPADSA